MTIDENVLEELKQQPLVKAAMDYSYQKALKDVYCQIDEGVCEMCEHNDIDGRCFKECDKNGWEYITFRKWLWNKILECN